MSPMLKALLAAKKSGYVPRKGAPRERLLLVNPYERRIVKALSHGTLDKTPSGVDSAYMEGRNGSTQTNYNSVSHAGVSPGSGSNSNLHSSPSTSNNNGPQNQNNPGGSGSPRGVSPGSGNNAPSTSNNNGPQNRNNPGGSGPRGGVSPGAGNTSNNNAPATRNNSPATRNSNNPNSGGLGPNTRQGGVGVQPGSGSDFTQQMRDRLTQSAQREAVLRTIFAPSGPSAADLAKQYSQYRSPADFPFAGAEDLTRDEFNRVQASADIRPQSFGFTAPPSAPRTITSGKYLTDRAGLAPGGSTITGDVEDLTRPDLANPDMQTGDWTYDPETGVRTPVYNGLAPGAIPTPRISPLKQSPVMRTPVGDIPMWNPKKDSRGQLFDASKLQPDAQAMVRDMQLAAFNKGTLVQPFSGLAPRSSGTKNHPTGNAVDVRIMDPATGKALPNFQSRKSFADYENYAKAVRQSQVANNPELNNNLRWGGYFSNKGTPFGGNAVDMMHFDVNPKMRGAMGLGDWQNGAGKKLASAYGLGNPTIMAAADVPPHRPNLLDNVVKPGVSAIKNMFADADIPIPRPKPMIPSTVAKPTSIPRPVQKPMVPSIVAPSRGVPIPRQKPSMQTAQNDYNIEPAGWDIRAALSNGLQAGGDALQRANTALEPIAQGVKNYGVDATQNYVNAKIAAMRQGQTGRAYRTGPGGEYKSRRRRRPIRLGNEISAYA